MKSKDIVITEEVAYKGPLINVYTIRVAMWRKNGNKYYVIIEKMRENLKALGEDTLVSVRVKGDRQDSHPILILMDNDRSKILGILADGA